MYKLFDVSPSKLSSRRFASGWFRSKSYLQTFILSSCFILYPSLPHWYQHYVMGRWAFLINCTSVHTSLIWRILICRRIRGGSQPGWWVQPLTSYQDTYRLHTCSFSSINPCNWYFQWPSNSSWNAFENSTFILFFLFQFFSFPQSLRSLASLCFFHTISDLIFF